METEAKWTGSGVYLFLLLLSLYLLHSHLLSRFTIHPQRVYSKRLADLPLRFRHDGSFKILQISDMHFGNGIATRCQGVSRSKFWNCSDANTMHFVRKLIEVEKPDFLAFTGDNIFGPTSCDAAESMLKAFTPAMESGLPWAAILGNHDQESTMTRSELMHFITLMDSSVSQVYPRCKQDPSREVNDIDGFGNYDLSVQGPFGSKMANDSVLDLYFLDSGDRATVGGRRTYGWIKESQLRWLRSLPQAGKDENHKCASLWDEKSIPPALTFFHIPNPEIRRLYRREIVGRFQEAVASSFVTSGVLDTLVSMKNVKAAFMGHDHLNDFCGQLSGVWFCYGGATGYHGYGREGWARRARVISAQLARGRYSWMGVESIRTWKRLDDDKMSKIDEHVLWQQKQSTETRC